MYRLVFDSLSLSLFVRVSSIPHQNVIIHLICETIDMSRNTLILHKIQHFLYKPNFHQD